METRVPLRIDYERGCSRSRCSGDRLEGCHDDPEGQASWDRKCCFPGCRHSSSLPRPLAVEIQIRSRVLLFVRHATAIGDWTHRPHAIREGIALRVLLSLSRHSPAGSPALFSLFWTRRVLPDPRTRNKGRRGPFCAARSVVTERSRETGMKPGGSEENLSLGHRGCQQETPSPKEGLLCSSGIFLVSQARLEGGAPKPRGRASWCRPSCPHCLVLPLLANTTPLQSKERRRPRRHRIERRGKPSLLRMVVGVSEEGPALRALDGIRSLPVRME